MTERTRQKSIVLILARELASKLATPMFVVDAEGNLVFFNEPAESILGQSFAEAGELSADEWGGALFAPEDTDGSPLPFDRMPISIALTEHKPAHRSFRITGLDEVKRTIAATAFPLFARAQEFVGAVAIFWEEPEG
jgi:PAS domain-containing protein